MTYVKITDCEKNPFTGNLWNYLTVDGYTKRSGAPTNKMVKIEGSNRWYRVYQFCVSNTGTLFIKTKDNPFLIVQSWQV